MKTVYKNPMRAAYVEKRNREMLAKGYIPTVIQSIQGKYPGISVGVRVLENDLARQATARGEVDFGIFFDPQSYRDLAVRAFVDVVLGFVTPSGHPFGAKREARFSACSGSKLIVPAKPLAVYEQISVLEGTTGVVMEKAVSSDNIQMITSLVLQGVGIGILTSLDVITEVRRGLLSFTRISDPILRPMTLGLCTASARTPSYAAAMMLHEIENGFSQLSYPLSIEGPAEL